MKKLFVLLLSALLLCGAVSVAPAFATENVDGDSLRWEQETAVADSQADMVFDSDAGEILFSGSGYRDRQGMKFGFRCMIAFSAEETSMTIRFPDEFQELYDPDNNGNLHYAIAIVNTATRWWNTNDNATKSLAFIVRPETQTQLSIELAGRYGMNAAGYGDVSSLEEPYKLILDETRSVKFGLKKGENDLYSIYLNDEKLADLNRPLDGEKTMSQYLASDFPEGKCYWQLGATRENDSQNTVTLSYTLIDMTGALDAFQEPVVPDPGESGDPMTPTVTVDAGGSSFNAIYAVYYPIVAAVGIGALVMFLLYRKKNL